MAKARLIQALSNGISGLGNLSIKNRLRDRFSSPKSRHATRQIFFRDLGKKTGPVKVFWTGTMPRQEPVLLENLYNLTSKPVLLSCLKFVPQKALSSNLS
jgi:hypothetical protein